MTQDNMLDIPDIRYDHTNLKTHWEELGEPDLERCNMHGVWVQVSQIALFSKARYRIKGDANWELRERWLASGRKLQIELWDAEDKVWDLVTGMHRIGEVKYRERLPKCGGAKDNAISTEADTI